MAMSKYLPYDCYSWQQDANSKFTPEFILRQQEEQTFGYFLEVDLDYDKSLHSDHRSFPLAPNHMEITGDMLSPHSRSRLVEQGVNVHTYKSRKLVASLTNKRYYICHYLCLKLYLELGMKLVKVHRVLRFKQAPVYKPYIEYCTSKRSQSTNTFEKSLYKLLANSLYGKQVEKVRNYMTCKVIRNDKQAINSISNPTFKSMRAIDENLCFSFHALNSIKLDKPYLIGSTILELSKEFMLRSFYKRIRPLFISADLIFSDTDSMALKITSARDVDPARILFEEGILDTSNYPHDHPLYSQKHAFQLGFFKDEHASKKMTAFIGIRSKLYSMQVEGHDNSQNTMKGIRFGLKKKVTFQTFSDILHRDLLQLRVLQYHITSKSDVVGLTEVNKVAIIPFDDKTYMFCDIHTRPYGDESIEMSKERLICPVCEQIKRNYSIATLSERQMISRSNFSSKQKLGLLKTGPDEKLQLLDFTLRNKSKLKSQTQQVLGGQRNTDSRNPDSRKRRYENIVAMLTKSASKVSKLSEDTEEEEEKATSLTQREIEKLAKSFINYECSVSK